jgi:predicted phage tail protein
MGSKGGSGSSFKTVPDSLRSNDSFEMLLGLGSGRWKGLVNGLKSLEVNNVPLENTDGTSNFKDFAVIFADGDPTQTQLVNFKLGGGGGTTAVNTTIGNTNQSGPGPWVNAAVTTPGADFIDIRLVISALYYQDKNGVRANNLTLELEMRPQGSANWINPLSSNAAPTYNPRGYPITDGFGSLLVGYMLQKNWATSNTWNDPNPGYMVINDKTTSAAVKELRISVPNTGAYANKTWEVRIRMLQPELRQADPIEERRTIQFESVAAIKKTVFGSDEAWRGLAWLQVVGKASEQISGVPELRGIYDTLIMKVPPPSVFNPDVRAYTSNMWDGSYVMAYTNDPAWGIKALIEDPTSGIAAIAPGATLDKWDALEASKYFSQLVPNGKGGTHPRFSMNVSIDQAQNTDEVIQYIAGAVNSLAVDTGDSKWRLKVDKPETPTAIFSRDNIIGDFQYSHTDVDSRYNDYTVTFLNEETRYSEDRARVFDQAHIDRFGRKATSIVAVGATNRQEALRRAMYRLRVSTNENRLVNFQTNRQGLMVQPLSIILVADTDLAYTGPGNEAKRTTTRLESMSGSTLTLGANVRLEIGVNYTINLTVPNPDYNPDTTTQPTAANWQKPTIVISRNVTNTAAQRGNVGTLYLDSPLPANTPEKAAISLNAVGLPSLPVQYRVMEVTPDASGEVVTIQALVVDTGKWDAMDNVNESAILGQVSDTKVPSPGLPAGGMFSVKQFQSEFQTKRVLTVTWDRPGSLFLSGFKVQCSFNGAAWQTLTENNPQSYLEIQQPENGTYRFRIYSQDRRERLSAPLEGVYIVTENAADYASLQSSGPLAQLPFKGRALGERYTTTDQNPNQTFVWNGTQWVAESNYVDKADQIQYPDGTGTLDDWKPADQGATVGGVIGENIKNPDGTIFDPGAPGGGAEDFEPPAVPTGLNGYSVLTDIGASLRISWTGPADADLAGYNLVISDGGTPVSFLTANPYYEIKLAERNKTYTIKVQAYDRAGNYGGFTPQINVTTVRDTVAPAAPTGLSVRGSFKTFGLTWTNPSDLDIAKIDIFTTTVANFSSATYLASVNATPGSTGTYTHTGRDDNETRYYWVRAVDTSGNIGPINSGNAGAVTARLSFESFTPGLEPIATVTSLPNPSGYTGPKNVFNTADGRMYSFVSGTWVDVAAIPNGSIGADKIKAVFGGGNLVRNSSFEQTNLAFNIGTEGTISAGFSPYNNSGAADPCSFDVQQNGRRGGWSQLVSWSRNSTTKGIYLQNTGGINNSGLMKPNSTYILSFYARGEGSAQETAMTIAFNITPAVTYISNPTIKSDWQRYVVKFVTGATVDTNIFITTLYKGENPGYIYFDDIQLEEGDYVTGYAPALLPGEITNELLAAQSIAAINIKSDAIETRHIKANTIQANQLLIGSRPVSTTGINMRVRSDFALQWDLGYLTYIDTFNAPQTIQINGSAFGGQTGNVYYIVWNALQKLPDFTITTDRNYIASPDWVHIATWTSGTSDLIMIAGVGTRINGNNIVTGTLSADKLIANSITTGQLAVGAVQAGNIAAGAITVDKLLVQANSTTLNPDPQFRDTSFWRNENGTGVYPLGTTPGGRGWYNAHPFDAGIINAMGGRNYAMLWDAYGNADTMRYHLFSNTMRNLRTGITYEAKATVRNASNQTITVYVRGYRIDGSYLNDIPVFSWGPNEVSTKTVAFTPNHAELVGWQFIVFNSAGSNFAGNAEISDLQITQQMLGTSIKDGAITTNHITVGTLDGDRIRANTIVGGAFRTDTSLPGTITVGITGVSIETVRANAQTGAADPATRINSASTTIDPGRISIGGGGTLNNWRQGGNTTLIAGGAIAANTIAANKLTIGNRNVSIQGIDFSYDRTNNILRWTNGIIFYVNDAGSATYVNIAAGSAGASFGSGGIRYVYWQKDQTVLYNDVDNWPGIVGGDYIMMCTWTGGSNFIANYGATIIDGDRITANSIVANKLAVTSLSSITGTIGLLRTATSGMRSELDNNGLHVYDAGGNLVLDCGIY